MQALATRAEIITKTMMIILSHTVLKYEHRLIDLTQTKSVQDRIDYESLTDQDIGRLARELKEYRYELDSENKDA